MTTLILSITISAIQTFIATSILRIFNRLDKEVNFMIKRKDIIIFMVISFLSNIITLQVTKHTLHLLQIIITTILLLIHSYMDLQIKQVYSIITYTGLILNIIILIISKLYFDIPIQLEIIGLILILVVISIFKQIGTGDVFVYVIIAINYICIKSEFAYILLALNVLISQVLFILLNIKLFVKNRKEKVALVPYILAAWIILLIALK